MARRIAGGNRGLMVPAADLDLILEHAREDFRTFASARLFVTGGTGFVGTWLVESLLAANRRLGLGATAVVLSRDPQAYAYNAPQIAADPAIELIRGDVRELPADLGRFDGIIHAATPSSARINAADPGLLLDTILDGGRNIVSLAERSGEIPLLFTSSGAVYGRQPADVARVSEEFTGAPDPLSIGNVYFEGKRCAELQCAIATARGVQAKIARLFAFVGPHLPLDEHFAVGNFLRDALTGRDIAISGDGRALRSYLYAADMAIWLWRIFARGQALRAYNVGSEYEIDIAGIADRVRLAAGSDRSVSIAQCGLASGPPDRYVPSTQRARSELGLAEYTPLDLALTRTLNWHRSISALPQSAKGLVHS